MNTQALLSAAVKTIRVHWSESTYVNEKLGADANFNIEKDFSVAELSPFLAAAAAGLPSDYGYDKTKLTVTLHDGSAAVYRMDLGCPGCPRDLLDFLAQYVD